MNKDLALELQKMETNAWRNEALSSRETIRKMDKMIGAYAAWMAKYDRWLRNRRSN